MTKENKNKNVNTRSAATGLEYTVETALVGRDEKNNVVVYVITSQTRVSEITGTLAKMDADVAISQEPDKKA